MAQEQDIQKPANNDEIEPLSDEGLEEVAGGACSGSICTFSEEVANP
jgi:hypothetical protein